MRAKTKFYALTAASFLAFLFALMRQAAAAGSITITPSAQAPGASVVVAGTGFGSNKSVGIGFGSAVAVTNVPFQPVYNRLGPHKYNFTGPIKPGTFVGHVDVMSGLSVYDLTDNGTGLLGAPGISTWATLNYATGEYASYTTVDPTGIPIVHTASYTRYQYNVTPAVGVSTTASGAFTINITVPAVANGSYNVTVIDASGNLATAPLNVNSTIPEVLPFGAIILLSSAAVAASSWHFRKRPRIVK